jgi:hypothetical protein
MGRSNGVDASQLIELHFYCEKSRNNKGCLNETAFIGFAVEQILC